MWQIKLLSEYFSKLHSTPYEWLKLNKYWLIGFWKFMNGPEGMYMNGGNFFKEWPVTNKIIESVCRQGWVGHVGWGGVGHVGWGGVGHVGMGCVIQGWSGVTSKWKVTDKIIEWTSFNSHSTFFKWPKVKK